MKPIIAYEIKRTCKFFILAISIFCLPNYLISQNCSINANVDLSICANDSMVLSGAKGGLFSGNNSTIWIQISGPSVVIQNPYQIETHVLGYVPDSQYVFRLLSVCEDSVVIFDDVTVTVKGYTKANAGSDTTACPGVIHLNANQPNVSEMGYWSIEGVNNGVTIDSINLYNSPIHLLNTKSGETILKWTILNEHGCDSWDEVKIVNRGGVTPVSAGSNRVLNVCYNYSTSALMSASYGGDGFDGQKGTWSTISGPNIPVFTAPNNNGTTVTGLIEGAYTFEWNVTGECVSNSKIMTITVGHSTGPITTANVSPSDQIFCDTTIHSVFLTGNVPQYVNETSSWTQVTNLPATIETPNATSTLVSNLSYGTYKFNYTIKNNVTGCVMSKIRSIIYTAPSNINITSSQNVTLPLDSTTTVINYIISGGNTTSYAIISNPLGVINNPQYVNSTSPQKIKGLNKVGQYIIRFKRFTNGGNSSCSVAFADVIVNVSLTPTQSYAGTNQILGCNIHSTTLVGNTLMFENGEWTQINGPSMANIHNIHDHITLVDNLTNGVYTFRWSVNGGINSPTNTSDVTVTVASAIPNQSNAGVDLSGICYDMTIGLNGNQPQQNEVGTWSVIPDNGIHFSNINIPNPLVNGFSPSTNYQFIWTLNNACGYTSDTMNLITNSTTGPIISNAGLDICLPQGTNSFYLNGNNPNVGIGEWSQVSGPNCLILDSNLFNSQVVNLTSGTYKFVWTLEFNNCVSNSDTVVVTVLNSPLSSNAGINQIICSNSVVFNANNPTEGIGMWTQFSGTTLAVFNNINNSSEIVSGLTPGTYLFGWQIMNGACKSNMDTISIMVSQLPSTSNAGVNQTICAPDTIATLNANQPINGSGYWTQVSGPSVLNFSSYNSPSAKVWGFQMGSYTLRWSIQGGVNCPVSYSDVVVQYSPLANAGATIKLCNRTNTSLVGTSNSNGTWSLVSGPNVPIISVSSSNSVNITNLIPGNYVFKYSIVGSCPSSSTVSVINYAMPSVVNAGTNQDLCNATSVQLNATAPTLGTGYWTFTGSGSGTFSPNKYANNATYNGLVTGNSYFTWIVINGTCTSQNQITVRNYGLPTPSNAGSDKIICGLSTTLNANIPVLGNGTWSMISGTGTATFSNLMLPNSLVTCSDTGLYIFRWTISTGNGTCPQNDSYSEVKIRFINIAPTAPNAGINQYLCESNSTLLDGNNVLPGVGYWKYISGPTAPAISDSLNPTSSISLPSPGDYKIVWKANYNGCKSEDTIAIKRYSIPSASNAGLDIEICNSTPLILNANNPSIGNGTWTQISGPSGVAFVDSNSYQTSVNSIIPGVYVFEWTISNGVCVPLKDSVEVHVVENPTVAYAGINQNLCSQNSTILIGNTPSVGVGTWSFESGTSSPAIDSIDVNSVIISGLIHGAYNLKWTIANGICANTSLVQIVNHIQPTVLVNVTPTCSNGIVTIVSNNTVNQTFSLCDSNGTQLDSWIGYANSNSFSNLPNGNYSGKINTDFCETTLSSSVQLINFESPISPDSVIVNRNFFCPSDSGNIQLSAISGVGDTLLWYKNSINSTSFAFGNNIVIPSPTSTTTYFVNWKNRCGQSSFKSVTVDVFDNEPPIAQIDTIIVNTPSGDCSLNNVNIGYPTISDNCGIASVVNNKPITFDVGTYNIEWIITDLSGNNTAIHQIVVVNGSPKANMDDFLVLANQSTTLSVLNNDIDCDHNLNFNTIELTTLPSNGSASVNQVDGTIIYTPNHDFVGTDGFEYKICDSTNLCTSSTVSLNTYHPNTPPIIHDSTVTTFENTSVSICLPITDDYETHPFILNSLGCVQHGTVTGTISGSQICVNYTPTNNFIGTDSICIIISDSGGLSALAYIVVNTVPKVSQPVIAIAKNVGTPVLLVGGNYLLHYQIIVENLGQTTLTNIKIFDSLSTVFVAPSSFVISSLPLTSGNLISNINFNGITDNNLLSIGSTLNSGETNTIDFELIVSPNGQFGTFYSSAYAIATGLNGLFTSDISDDGINPDSNNNGNPNEIGENDPTPVILEQYSQIGIAQKLISVNQQSDNSYMVNLQFIVKNLGNDLLNSVQIENDINNTFANTTIAIQNITVQSGNLVANPLNNGFFTNVFLDSSHSYLNVGETAELLVQINVQDKFGITKYLNSVQISGIASNAINVSDISDDGVSIDENSNGIANEIGENDPTLIQIGVSEVWIPEGFSPNGDGKNDYFIIDGNEYYKINLEVYNRWGAVVYQSKDYQNDWNGFSNVGVHMDNLQLPDGTYFYIVKLNNGEIPIQGSITINH